MLKLPLLLAQFEAKEIEELKNAARASKPKLFGTDVTLILALFLGLAAILFFWAFFIRKRPKNARGSLVVQRVEKHSGDAYGSSGRRKRRKRRADHPSNWGRNPTLSETGGLPPPRPEEPEAPQEPPPSPSTPSSPPAR
jgi:hypothetical protein